jgi:hypothetical protein
MIPIFQGEETTLRRTFAASFGLDTEIMRNLQDGARIAGNVRFALDRVSTEPEMGPMGSRFPRRVSERRPPGSRTR